jgi:DNA polymerase IV
MGFGEGLDDRPVNAQRETKSISNETTFDRDIDDKAELTRVLVAHCERVAARLRNGGLSAGGVTLKLRLPDFSLRTRSRIGLRAAQLTPRLFAAEQALLDARPGGTAYRLPGLAATDLSPSADADDLIDGYGRREKLREAAIASLRDKFGAAAVQRGLAFRPSSRKP